MAAVIKELVKGYHYLNNDMADPRTNHWALVSSPVPVVLILLGYLYIVNKWGIEFMKNRRPYQLKNTIIIFNITQILFNVWMFYEILQGGWLYEYSWRCQPVDRSNSPTALRMANVCWWYLVCKLVDLLDTVFFVLRKKNGHVSYLHVHHHFSMPAVSWVCVKYYPGGHGTMVGLLNTLVHMIMYSYYLISGLGPQYQKYLWWKKYLTIAQMTQFLIIIFHTGQILFTDCDYTKFCNTYLFFNSIFFFIMFASFYRKTYLVQKNQLKPD